MPYRVPAVMAASRILAALSEPDGDGGLRQTDLAARAELSPSTAHNLLTTLEDLRYVERDADTRLYRLGPGLVALGHAALRDNRAVELATGQIPQLANETGLSFAVAQVVSPTEAVILAHAYPPAGVHVAVTLGDRYGPLDGAIGKALLAQMADDEAERTVRRGELSPRTPATITAPDALLRDVLEVRRRGWASSIGELNENHAVAAAVRGADARQDLVLLALGFPAQLPPDEIPQIGTLLREHADAITRASGGSVNGAGATDAHQTSRTTESQA